MKYFNLATGCEYQGQPIEGMYNPASDHAYMVAHGWRLGELPDLSAGFTRIVSGAHQDPDRSDWCILDYLDYTPEAWASKLRQDKIATLTPELLGAIAFYRMMLREDFGVGAETNRSITASSVGQFYGAKIADETITTLELARMNALQYYFNMLSEWNGTGETWTLPYESLQ